MTRGSRIILLITCIAVAPSAGRAEMAPELPKSEEREAELLALAGEGFKIRRTTHFAIAYDTSYETLRGLEGRLEGTYNAIHRFFKREGLIAATPESKLPVVLFAKPQEYADACLRSSIPAGATGGFYAERLNVSFFLDALARPDFAAMTAELDRLQKELDAARSDSSPGGLQTRDALLRQANSLRMQCDGEVERTNRVVINHEAAHQLMFNLGVHRRGARLPQWLVEGLATQFEVPQPTSETGLKKVNLMRLADFREAFGIVPSTRLVPPGRYRSAFDEGRMLRLRDLVADTTSLVAAGDQGSFRYAEAWSLVYFLHREQRNEFKEYVRRTALRKPGDVVSPDEEIALFETLFGPITEEFEDRWVHFTLGQFFDPSRMDE